MSVAYPHDKIPVPVYEGFESKLSSNFYRQPMDDGNFRSRRIYDGQPIREKLSWILSWEELALWEAWVEHELGGGVGEFTLQLTPTAPLYKYKFANDPDFSFIENRNSWLVTVEVHRHLEAPAIQPIDYLPDWPEELPEPEKSGYSYSIPGQVTRGNITGAGDPGARRRFSGRVVHYTARWLLTGEQLEIFQDFLNNDLAAGNAYFKAPFANGMGFKFAKSMFMSPPVTVTNGSKFLVTGNLATSSAALMSRSVYLLGGRVAFNDVVTLQDFINILYSRNLEITDSVNLNDFPVRNYNLEDSLSFAENLGHGIMRGLQDSFSLSDLVKLGSKTSQGDAVGLLDTINTDFRKPLSDKVELVESIFLGTTLLRSQTDGFAVGDELTLIRGSFTRGFSESLDVRDSGVINIENYVEAGYFAEYYVGSEVLFIG